MAKKSAFAEAVDEVQAELRPLLKSLGFRVRGRTFNRKTAGGLIQVVNFQMGPSDPPGTTYIPGLRENLYGFFTVNLGVYVPEVAELQGYGAAKAWVQESQCSIRDRLGRVGDAKEEWWPARAVPEVIEDLCGRLVERGLPFLDRFSSRDLILAELRGESENLHHCAVPRIVCAIILAGRQETSQARALLTQQAAGSVRPQHAAYVQELAIKMGLGHLDA